mgnify:CR=1 FL=1
MPFAVGGVYVQDSPHWDVQFWKEQVLFVFHKNRLYAPGDFPAVEVRQPGCHVQALSQKLLHILALLRCEIDALVSDGPYEFLYCGVLQDFLRNLLQTDGTSKNHIFRCLHLLGDQTRFDIFCYLLEHPAYGQELSDHFGLARNTIHHHMNKLFDAGLVTYMVKGTRVYYSIDKDHFSNLLDQQRQLLLHGYRTPGK